MQGAVPAPVSEILRDLGVDEALGDALHAQVARALENGARATKRKHAALAKARGLATQPPASSLEPLGLVPLVLAMRDALKRGELGGRTSRARSERLDRAADAALRGLSEAAARAHRRRGASGRKGAAAADGDGEDLLQRLVGVSPDAVVTLRDSGRLGLWNPAASRLTGRRRWEVHRSGLASIFREEGALDALLAELEARGRVGGRELTIADASGEGVPVRVHGARLKGPPGGASRGRGKGRREADPERYLLLMHDLSELHHIRRRLIETEKLSAMAKIAGSVAHEFRNPLNSLFLTTDLLEDELEGHEEVRSSIAPSLSAIREEIERLNQIITHYLSLSRIAGSSPEEVDLGELVEGFAKENAERLGGMDVRLRVRVDEGDHRITADPNQVRRILVNLVENAVDAVTAEGEEDGRRARRGTITLLVRRMRRSIKLSVKDNGPGIPEEIRARVLEPFFTSKVGGSGLGLYLVREIALASDGTMTLSSTPSRGTSVSIRWPFAKA
jgi:signal transduction histidine kinase